MKPTFIVSIGAAILVAFASLACMASVQVLDNVTVFDGSALREPGNQRIVIEEGLIKAVGSLSDVALPPGARVIDLAGKTVIPGLISDHSHIGQYEVMATVPPYNEASILRQLHQYSAYGVTTVVALGMNKPEFYTLRAKLRDGSVQGPDLFGADKGIGVPQGAPPVKVDDDQLDRPATAAQARQAVRAAAARGTDLIKLWLDDFQGAKLVKMSPQVYRAVIDEAHKQGLRVVAHVYYQADAKDLIRAGVDILGHGIRDSRIDDEFVNLMHEHSTWYIPTLGVDEAFFRFAENPDLLEQSEVREALNPKLIALFQRADWRQQQLSNLYRHLWHMGLKNNQFNTAKLVEAGVNVGFGTDSGAMPLRIPGYAEHRELELLVEAGLTPSQALTLATRQAASALGLKDRGEVQAGKRADLLILDGDPTVDIKAISRVSVVFLRGVQVERGGEPF